MYRFVLTGRIKPYVRMTRRGKWVDSQAQEYRASQEAIRWQLQSQMVRNGWGILPAKTPLAMTLAFSWRRHNCDLTNIAKAVEDACNGIVWHDDRWVDRIVTERTGGPRDDEQTVLTVTILYD